MTYRKSLFKERRFTVWIWGRGWRISRWRLIWLALTQKTDIYLHRESPKGKPGL